VAHEYEVDAVNDDGKTKTHKITVAEEKHHEKWKDYALFLSMLANVIGISKDAISGVRYMRRKPDIEPPPPRGYKW
jgi:hypothetical protein